MAMIDALPYLNAVVMEGLRLVDTIASYETRVVPSGGCMIEGYFIPAGVRINFSRQRKRPKTDQDNPHQTIVATQPHLINRIPTNFHDPETFNPSRWLLPRDQYLALAKYMWTFSSGPRGCIAKEFALSSQSTYFPLSPSILLSHSLSGNFVSRFLLVPISVFLLDQ